MGPAAWVLSGDSLDHAHAITLGRQKIDLFTLDLDGKYTCMLMFKM